MSSKRDRAVTNCSPSQIQRFRRKFAMHAGPVEDLEGQMMRHTTKIGLEGQMQVMSMAVVEGKPTMWQTTKEVTFGNHCTTSMGNQALGWNVNSFREAQVKDLSIGPVLGWIKADANPEWPILDSTSPC